MKTTILFCAIILLSFSQQVYCQQLVQTKLALNQGNEASILQKYGLTGENKRNGFIYRLRKDISIPDLEKTLWTENLEQFITEETDFGYFALFRTPAGSNDFRFVVVIYDEDKRFIKEFDLNVMSNNYNCELQDIRYRDGFFYFNMACPGYSSGLNGACSSLYCLNIEEERIEWNTPYLVSNDIFIVHENYIISGYGFTDEPDFLYLIDRKTGKVLSKVKLKSAHEYIEVKKNVIYVTDYSGNVYQFTIK